MKSQRGRLFSYKIPWRLSFSLCWNGWSRKCRFGAYIMKMFPIWILLVCVMAAVMPFGHGGDGVEDPPPPSSFNRGSHKEDNTPPVRRTRGKARNKGLTKALAQQGGRPLSLSFDRGATYLSVGELAQFFTHVVSMFIWRHIALTKTSWKYVSPEENNALHEHLRMLRRIVNLSN